MDKISFLLDRIVRARCENFHPPEENEIFFLFSRRYAPRYLSSFNRSEVGKVSLAATTFTVRRKPNTLIRSSHSLIPNY